ncbi:dihydroxyacetone kinase subunit DhaK [Mycoplasmopsis felis]|nr:dihydroxyacetone kinase subunit DhaK [Mycoplasmopsis felis]MCU9938578.1 dihydroxyacetone kinase subunit DhaK [Mycoplasmopsis felis]
MELFIATNDIHNYLESKNIKIYSSHVGNFMTSLEMQGMSISLLKLDNELKELLDFPTEVRNWK